MCVGVSTHVPLLNFVCYYFNYFYSLTLHLLFLKVYIFSHTYIYVSDFAFFSNSLCSERLLPLRVPQAYSCATVSCIDSCSCSLSTSCGYRYFSCEHNFGKGYLQDTFARSWDSRCSLRVLMGMSFCML